MNYFALIYAKRNLITYSLTVNFLFFFNSLAMSDDHEFQFQEEHEYRPRHGGHDTKHAPASLEERFAHENYKFEIGRIERTFSNIDDLFKLAIIKVQKIDGKGDLGEETIMPLQDFLGLPHDAPAIISVIEKTLRRSLNGDEKEIVQRLESPSLPGVVKELWQAKFLTDQKAQMIVLKNAPMSSKDLIRLVENGAARTEKNYFVQLRTGAHYGDTLKLFETVNRAIKLIKSDGNSELASLPISHLLTEPVRTEVADAFGDAGPFARDVISDANVIREMRRHFLFVSTIGMPIIFRPGTVSLNPAETGGAAVVTPSSSVNLVVTPKTISALLIGTHYFKEHGSSLTNYGFINPLGITYGGNYNWDGAGVDWWLNYSSGFLGAGANYTVNFDKGTSWSNGQPTYLSFGAMAGGWRNNLMLGISMSTMLANSIGIGASAQMSISRSHDVTYLGQCPMDGMIAATRGKHKIQIDDMVGVGAQMSLALNFSAAEVPITVAFRAGAEFTRARVYRTHTDLITAQDMLSEAGVPGVLYLLGKKIKETRIPQFEHPEVLIDGDELIETKLGRLSGAFVIGLETMVPIHALRIGGTIELTAEFELGLQRLPNDKYQVSIKPERIYEIGVYASMFNMLGAGYVKSMAVARKQIFIFDFINPEARRAYFDLIHHGRLPTSEDIEVYAEDRGPEYLLTEFRAQNEQLAPRGISRTFLEKVRIFTNRKHVGFNVPLMDAVLDVVNKIDEHARKNKERFNLRFEGIDREFVRSYAKSVSTNGVIAVRKSVFGGRRSEGQGFKGRYNQDIFVTHRRLHTIDDSLTEFAGNKWQFDGLVVHFQLEDTKITGNEENEMAEKINKLFSTFIGSFEYHNSKALRVINIEREFNKRDLAELAHHDCRERISIASQTTCISQHEIATLLKSLRNKHPDHQGLLVKHFIETNAGATGFAAIHQLLGAKPEDLTIRTESGYASAVLNAKKFITAFSRNDPQGVGPVVNLVPVKTKNNKKHIREFYIEARNQLRDLDNQLRLLYDDKYLIDDESPLHDIYGSAKVKELIEKGVRQDKAPVKTALVTARKTILEFLNLHDQNVSAEERDIIYKMAGNKRLRIKEQVERLLAKYEPHPISVDMSKDYLRERLRKTWDAIAKIDARISRLLKDHVMRSMDPEYVHTYHRDLTEMRRRLGETAAVDHLDFFQLELVKATIKRRYKGMRRPRTEITIDGALASIYSDDTPEFSSNNDFDFSGKEPPFADIDDSQEQGGANGLPTLKSRLLLQNTETTTSNQGKSRGSSLFANGIYTKAKMV